MIHVAVFDHPEKGTHSIQTSNKKYLDRRVKEMNREFKKGRGKITDPEKFWKFQTIGSPTRRT